MCWKYEDKYPGFCTDHIFFKPNEGGDSEVLENLAEYLGAEIDVEKTRPYFEEMLSKLHENGIMKPKVTDLPPDEK